MNTQSKYKTKEKENLINELKIILDKEDFNQKNLEKFYTAYKDSEENFSKLCSKCLECRKLDLPNDCLCDPNYCVKYKQDFWIISYYEDLKMYTEVEL